MNLIVYGSLINKKELKKEGISLSDVNLVKIKGFKRVFNQEPSYRFVDSINRAVLNIQRDNNSYFNAIVIKNLNKEYFNILDKREKGYKRVILEASFIETYDKSVIDNSFIYIGKIEKRNTKILPNENYLKICLEGVESFGGSFLEEFKKTTFKYLKNELVPIH